MRSPRDHEAPEEAPAFDAIGFVARHGVVLASAKGPVPNLAEAVAGETIRGSWWAHDQGTRIFRALNQIDESPDVLCFRLVGGKITFVHRRLWPALVRLVDELGKEALAAVKQEHTDSGRHRNVVTPFPSWVSAEVHEAARDLGVEDARSRLGPWVSTATIASRKRRRR